MCWTMTKIGFVLFILRLATTLPNGLSNQIIAESEKALCENICKGVNGIPDFDDETLICTCYIGKISDLDSTHLIKQGRSVRINLLILPKETIRKREINDIKLSENSTISVGVIKPKTSTTQVRKNNGIENGTKKIETKIEPQSPKTVTIKPHGVVEGKVGYPPTASTTNLPTAENLVGAIGPTGLKKTTRKPSPNPRRGGGLSRKNLSAETTRSILEGAKKQLTVLIERTRIVGFNPLHIGPEIEAIRTALIPLTSKHLERSTVDRSKLIEQIKEREKERHARLQSRFGHLDLKKKQKGNIVGASNPEEIGDKDEGGTKIITQPMD